MLAHQKGDAIGARMDPIPKNRDEMKTKYEQSPAVFLDWWRSDSADSYKYSTVSLNAPVRSEQRGCRQWGNGKIELWA
jgi:hypothetical protein